MIKVVNHFKDGTSKELLLINPEDEREINLFKELNQQDDHFKNRESEVSYGLVSNFSKLNVSNTGGSSIGCNLAEVNTDTLKVLANNEKKKSDEEELDSREFITAVTKPAKYVGKPNLVYDEFDVPKYSAYVKCHGCQVKIKNHVYGSDTFVRCRRCGTHYDILPYVEDISAPDEYGNYFVAPIYTRKNKDEFNMRRSQEIQSSKPVYVSVDTEAPKETNLEAMMKKALNKQPKWK